MHGISTASDRVHLRAVCAILDAMRQSPALHRSFVLKGGLALQLAFRSPRRSEDLDFNATEPVANEITEGTASRLLQFCSDLNAALAEVQRRHEFTSIATAAERLSEEIPTLMAIVRYQSADGDEGGVKLQVTLSEIICDTAVREVNGTTLHVASLDDIIAEKVKALLQQISRDTIRSSDVFDLWYFTSEASITADPGAVTQYLLEKCKQWRDVPHLSKSQFRRKSVIERAAAEYEDLRHLLRDGAELVPFHQAYACVLSFIDRLDLPA